MSKHGRRLRRGIVSVLLGGASLYYLNDNREALPNIINTTINRINIEDITDTGREINKSKKYRIKKADRIVDEADTLEQAIKKSEQIERSIVINTYINEWVYCNLNPYLIITDTSIHDFNSFFEAYSYAQNNKYTSIYYKDNKTKIWDAKKNKENIQLKVPFIRQLPELPRGCEVTSLGMLLAYRDVNVDKMLLAEQVTKETSPYYKDKNGKIYYGNPYRGFVGNMYNLKENGYGVYHEPIAELAKRYKEEKVIDLTGIEFNDLLYFVQEGNPIWVITNSSFKPLGDEAFNIWHTPTGIVKVTKQLHSVVITGFSEDKVYINDPLDKKPNKAVEREDFKKAWEQMGNQGITIIK